MACAVRSVGGATVGAAGRRTGGRPLSIRCVSALAAAWAVLAAAPAAAGVPVQRVSGTGRVATAVATSRLAFPDGASTVVVAGAGGFADAMVAVPLAADRGGPLLLVDGRVDDLVRGELARLGADRAVVVGGVAAVPYAAEADLEAVGVEVERIAGDSRYDTAALVALSLTEPSSEVFVASGDEPSDALAAGPVAASLEAPILLATRDALPPDTSAALRDLGATSVLVAGGPVAVSDAVLAQLPDAERIAGTDRYATAVALARLGLERGGLTRSRPVVATGRTFADPLAAGPLAVARRAPLLLVEGTDPAGASATYELLGELADEIEDVVAVGGPAALTDAVLARVAEAA